jgi:peptide/nickel transport system substrate-binding protein
MGLREVKRKKRRPRLGLLLTIIGIIACVAGALGAAVVSTILSESDIDNGDDLRTVHYGLTLLPRGFDPHIHSSAEMGVVLTGVYDTLVYRHPETQAFVSGLAENWTISNDALTYTFNLKEGVTFHDGTPFNADAVGVTLDRIADETTASRKARPLLGPYMGYTILDSNTIQLQLSEPYAPFLDALSQPYLGIASPTALANYNNATYQFNQVGTGPFKMMNFVPGERIVLERVPEYNWGPIFYSPYSNKAAERVIFRFYESPETRRIALEAGDVDIVGEVPPTDAVLLLETQEFNVQTRAVPGQPLQFFINTQNFPTDDIRFRQALLFATNRETINGAVFFDQFSDAAYGPLAAATPYYSSEIASFYGYSLDEARRLFEQAGVRDSDEDGFLEDSGIPFELRVVFMGYGNLPEVAQLLESQWLELGMRVELVQVASLSDLEAIVADNNYHLIAFNEFSAEPTILNRYFLSTSDRNWSRYSNAELDQWLAEATRTGDDNRRTELYTLAQRRIMEQALILPIRDYTNVVGLNSNVDGLIYFTQGWWPLLPNLVIED